MPINSYLILFSKYVIQKSYRENRVKKKLSKQISNRFIIDSIHA